MKLGFTGTRHGMTDAQGHFFRLMVCMATGPIEEFHHGDCVGADKEANDVVVEAHPLAATHSRPGDLPHFRAHCSATTIHPEKPCLERNRDIVDSCDVLVACPAEMTEQQRGGTWSTVRYARKVGRRVVLILPDGTTT